MTQQEDILRDFDEGAFCGLCQGSFRRRSYYAGGAKRETIKSWQIEIQRPASLFLTVTTIQVIQTSFPDKRRDYRFPSWTVSIDYFKARASKNTFQNLFIKGEENRKGGTASIFSRTDHFKPNPPAHLSRHV